jgi:RNA polymerase sigma-70 factor (ECF subfamily)
MADDKAGFDIAQLVAENYRAVYRYAFRLSGSPTSAEDLVQKVFLTAQGNLGQLRNINSARSWLFAILRNCFLREQQRQRPIVEADLALSIDHLALDAPRDAEIDSERLQAALGQIPELSRVILVMFYYEERSYREIARELALPIGTVMSRLARAKASLRAELLGTAKARRPPSRRSVIQAKGES